MKKLLLALALVAGIAVLTPSVQAQGAPTDFNKTLMKIFGKNNAFSATAHVNVSDTTSREATGLEMNMAYLNGKVRAEVDLAKMKSPDLPAEAVAQMKQFGMDKMTTIVLPESKKMMLIYPNLNSYVEMPLTGEDAAALEKEPKLDRKELGKETVDGHPTVKHKVTVTDHTGKAQEMTVWNATDLKDFPIKIEAVDEGTKVVMTYKNIKLQKPDDSLFEAPKGSKKYDSPQQLMMEKLMQQ